jgi:hypothetical protein
MLLVAFFTVFLALAYRYHVREMDHKQTLASIEKGIDPPLPQSAPWTARTYLLHGMIWLFAGIACFVALSAIAVTSHRMLPWEVRLAAVRDARQHGATPEELQILLNSPREEEGLPMGLGFLGFIPIGVGLAYLIFYRVESRKVS